jgi:pentatricopeptide repeat protein
MRPLQDKTVASVLRYLHRECMNGRHEGLEHVLALMRLRGVEPDFRALAGKYGSRRGRRLAPLKYEP